MKYSLLNLLMVLTAIATLFALYSSRQANIDLVHRHESEISDLKTEHELLGQENKSFRQELGCLTITQTEKIHAIKLRTDRPKTWSYRVYLPKGSNYYFACQVNSLPLGHNPPFVARAPGPNTISGLKDNGVGIGRPPGQYVVTLSIYQAENKWKYRVAVRRAGDANDGATGGSSINDTESKWPNIAGSFYSGGVSNQTEVSPDCSSLVLLDFRAMNGNVNGSSDSNQGAMLWVDVAK